MGSWRMQICDSVFFGGMCSQFPVKFGCMRMHSVRGWWCWWWWWWWRWWWYRKHLVKWVGYVNVKVKASTANRLLLAKASENSEFKRPNHSSGNTTPAEARLSQPQPWSWLWSMLWGRLSSRLSSRLSIRFPIRPSTRLLTRLRCSHARCSEWMSAPAKPLAVKTGSGLLTASRLWSHSPMCRYLWTGYG